ncbi:rhamnulokinase [Salibacterium qingdaonense]|uniref:Rhamnulokinase n=1 Tax=Salibacterium qingdaonense TaxID=266892 RepID=A0A1I4I162_9BACI|nr:rhamnulokinase family protein [Salibacterium qingdaonense]SFL48089.1 rhamnulokinase [Salibacterium qingdaonense]
MSVLAFDIGAGSGRAILADVQDYRLHMKEIHRFDNTPVQIRKRLHWDVYRLFHEIKQGIWKAVQAGENVEAIAIDTWAVDFGLLGKDGELLRAPYHYRDHHTDGVMEEFQKSKISRRDIFEKTGIQFLPFNTIYQLEAMSRAESPILNEAVDLLLMPDLLRYFLTGEKKTEFTNATTTQLFNPKSMEWDRELVEAAGVSTDLFQEVVTPGTVIGELSVELCEELDTEPIPVIAAGEHDTASAVAGIPALDQNFAYVSCGTWSLMGTEVEDAVINEKAFEWNFTNEGGVNDTFRLLKNIMGLWILEECRRIWEFDEKVDYGKLLEEAEAAPAFAFFIDPDDFRFLNPAHMPNEIKAYCNDTNQYVPRTRGEITRGVLESLALKYRYVFERTQYLAGTPFYGLHMVGGGIQNEMLCRFTSNALGKPVWAGPVEGSAIGNVMLQLMASGKVENLADARMVTFKSTEMAFYFPEEEDTWHRAYKTFCDTIGVNNGEDLTV